MRLGVFGGTFDPIHVGHLVAASEAASAFSLDRVIFVPAARPWQKASYATPEDRMLMTVLATGGDQRFEVSRIELDRRGPSYTVDTLRTLKDFYGDVELLFIGGADALRNVATWYEPEAVMRLARLIAVTRPGYPLVAPDITSGDVELLDMPGIDISSTDIRERVRTGRPIDHLVPERVVGYIRDNGLYSAGEEASSA